MTWSSPDNPSTVRRDAIRVLVGDVLLADQQIQDDGLAYFLAKYPDDDYQCASYVCLSIAGRYARQMDSAAGPAKASFEKRLAHYRDLAQLYWNAFTGLPPDGATGGGATLDPAAFALAMPETVDVAIVPPFFTRSWPP